MEDRLSPADTSPVAAKELVAGRRRPRLAKRSLFFGAAFVSAIGYIDPGNYATNIEAGAHYGHMLLWVVVWANLIAVLVQLLSSKLGLATGASLAEVLRAHLPPWARWAYWIQAEILAVATDLAEFVGAALGFKLLFDLTLFEGAVLTGIASWAILSIERRGLKPLELVIGSMLAAVALIYVLELAFSHPAPKALLEGALVPTLSGENSLYLAAGILGATVMPHVIYLHSALSRSDAQTFATTSRKKLWWWSRWDVGIAMAIASFVNFAMLAMAAAVFHPVHSDLAGIETAYRTLEPLAGPFAARIFGLSLIIAGLASTVVGTLAGQEVMQGFVGFRIPLLVRRAVTMAPSFMVILAGFDVTRVLVLSQVVLSFGIAFALIPLVIFTSRPTLMGDLANRRMTNALAWTAVVIVVALNIVLMVTT
ncbi:Nramp family divalent metal transporter [Chelativorans sp. EGI FJ00035]|uniref:Nramp family divalent metal transporter n=2 Tax=Chelativorans salis TaxID=2978478 RepID=A0ABT2LUA7_9HYPH|nr:Nramp family divalent metal transporter [Chelativorans sp. EGI FJ00035]